MAKDWSKNPPATAFDGYVRDTELLRKAQRAVYDGDQKKFKDAVKGLSKDGRKRFETEVKKDHRK